jgi:hypothetical protein
MSAAATEGAWDSGTRVRSGLARPPDPTSRTGKSSSAVAWTTRAKSLSATASTTTASTPSPQALASSSARAPALAVEGGPGGGEVRLGQHGGDAAVLGSRQRLAVHQDHAFHGGPPGGGKGRGDNGQGRTFGRPQGPRRRRYLGGHVPTQQRVDLLVGLAPSPLARSAAAATRRAASVRVV